MMHIMIFLSTKQDTHTKAPCRGRALPVWKIEKWWTIIWYYIAVYNMLPIFCVRVRVRACVCVCVCVTAACIGCAREGERATGRGGGRGRARARAGEVRRQVEREPSLIIIKSLIIMIIIPNNNNKRER